MPVTFVGAVGSEAGRAGGALVVLNAAPVPGRMANLLPSVDVLVVNETEAVGVLRLLAPDEPANATPDPAATAMALTRWVAVVVVTLGARGAAPGCLVVGP